MPRVLPPHRKRLGLLTFLAQDRPSIGESPAVTQRLIKLAFVMATLAVSLQGCLAASVAGAGIGVAGAAVGTAAKVGGAAVHVTGSAVGAVGHAVTGGGSSSH